LIERVGRYTVDAALDDTRRIYEARARGGCETCGCLYCRNFVEARDVVYSEALREQLTRLGVDWRKEDEAPEGGLPRSGLRVHIAAFSVMGRVVEIADDEEEDGVAVASDGARLSLRVKLEVPWVLDAEEPNW
jgi:hypothetical protein